VVLEVVDIAVIKGQETEFLSAFGHARPILAETEGCQSVRMTRGVESSSRFLLFVEWDSIDAHMQNFRGTDRAGRYRTHINPYLDGAPKVEHFNAA
jgi:heme-degrading monooxygenase HmoA